MIQKYGDRRRNMGTDGKYPDYLCAINPVNVPSVPAFSLFPF